MTAIIRGNTFMRNNYRPSPSGLAFTVLEFCELYKISRTSFYKEIRLGRLEASKIGSKTLVFPDAAERWAASLPKMIALANDLPK